MDDAPFTGWSDSYLEHELYVRRLARGLVQDMHVAEDLIQETWLKALETPARDVRSPRAWLARVLRSRAQDLWRSEDRRRTREELVAQRGVVDEGDVGTVLADDEEEHLRACLKRALDGVDERYATVLRMRYFEGLGLSAIADRLGVPLETVRTRSKRALKRLRANLDRECDGRRAAWLVPVAKLALPVTGAGVLDDLEPLEPLDPLDPLDTGRADAAPAAAPPTATGSFGASAWVGIAVVVAAVGLAAFWILDRESGESDLAAGGGSGVHDVRAEGAAADARPDAARRAIRAPSPEQDVSKPDAVARRADTPALRTVDRRGAPAPGVEVLVVPESEGPWTEALLTVVTDGQGRAVLPPSGEPRTLRPERGAPRHVKAGGPGEPRDIELVVPRGLAVDVLVVDAGGAPVSGAEVVATWPGWDTWLRSLGRTRVDGTLRIAAVDARAWIGARAGRTFSELHGLEVPRRSGSAADADERIALELRLAPSVRVSGVVLDEAGRAIAGARVRPPRVSLSSGVSPRFDAGEMRVAAFADPVTTGADGAFAIDVPSNRRVRALSAWAPGRGVTRFLLDDDVEGLRLVLQPEVVISGRVTGGDGRPVAGARVTVPLSGLVNRRSTRTGPNGRFVLTGLPAGEQRVDVSSEDPANPGAAHTTLVASTGDELSWNPVLTRTGALRGRATDATGAPLVGWTVTSLSGRELGPRRRVAWIEDERRALRTRTRADGRFAVFGCGAGPHLVRLYPPGGLGGVPAAFVADGRADGDPIELRADGVSSSAGVTGRLVRADGRPLGSAAVVAFSPVVGRRRIVPVDPLSGEFAAEGLSPSRWTFEAWVPPAPPLPLIEMTLDANATSRLGTLVYAGAGALTLAIVDAHGDACADAFVRLSNPAGALVAGRVGSEARGLVFGADGSVRAPYLAPGDWTLEVRAGDREPVRRELVVESGADELVTVVVR